MQYFIDIRKTKKNTAGSKAPRDISTLCERRGMRRFSMPGFPEGHNRVYQKLWLLLVCTFYWSRLERTVSAGDILVYQHPMYGNRVAERFIPRIQRKGCRCIALVHDLESLRRGISGVIRQSQKTSELADNVLLRQFDAIICHNDRMRDYLLSQGFDGERLVTLEIFDYLCDCAAVRPPRGAQPSIAIAGNLAKGKCAYIYNIFGSDGTQNPSLHVHLYGGNFEASSLRGNMTYHGSFSPEELPDQLEGDFGLVWDGNSAETCAGNTGAYLKYNNPHKTSLYLAAGMPVIVWSQSALADFVTGHGVGLTVDSLYELSDRIAALPDTAYAQMCANAQRISEQLKSGFYFNKALEQCIARLER